MNNAGSAYIFERGTDGNWTQVQKIVVSDRDIYDGFSLSLALSGNYAVVGAPAKDASLNGGERVEGVGAVYIFERDINDHWSEIQEIVASDRGEDYFGNQVSISGNYIIVTAPADEEDASGNNPMIRAGSAYIFERNNDKQWFEIQKIVASDRHLEDGFGCSAEIFGNIAIVGARFSSWDVTGENYLYSSGSAYIYKRDGNGIRHTLS